MNPSSPPPLLVRRGITVAALFSVAFSSVLLFCGAGSVPIENLLPQGSMQGDLNAGGHSLTNAATVQATNMASATGFTSTAATPLIGYCALPLNAQGMVLGTSKNGHTFNSKFIDYIPPDGGNSRDVSLLINNTTQLPIKYNGLYWYAYTAGTFGYVNYIGIASSPDMEKISCVTEIPITGTAVGTVATTATASSGSSTITLPGTAISGLTNGYVYSVTGNAHIPAGACFVYNSSSTTQAIGVEYIGGGSIVSGLVTSGAVSGAVRLTFINNAWSPTWYTDSSGNVGIILRASSQSGNSQGTPGIGYITCSNPGTFTSWSDFTPLSGVHSVANGAVSLNIGGTWYLFLDEPNSARSNMEDLSYYTSTSPTGTYTYQGFMGIGAAYQAAFTATYVESNQPLYLGGNNWRIYFANQSTGVSYYAESTTGLTGSWSTPAATGFPQISDGVAAGHPFLLSNSDDAYAAGQVTAPSPYGLVIKWLNALGRNSLQSVYQDFYIGGPTSGIQFNDGFLQISQLIQANGSLNVVGNESVGYSSPTTQNYIYIGDPVNTNGALYLGRTGNAGDGFAGTAAGDLWIKGFDPSASKRLFIGAYAPALRLNTDGSTLTMGNLTMGSGTVFSGNASGATSLNAGNVSSGTLADARLSANVPLLNATNTFTADQTIAGNILSDTVGCGFSAKEGTGGMQGTATLASGTVTVTNSHVTANSRFFLTPHGSTINAVGVSSVVAGTSFTIKSGSGTDTNTVDYEVFQPAP